ELEGLIDLALIGGKSGREVIDRFIDQVKNYLTPKGIVQVVQSSITGIERTMEKFTRLGFKVEVTARKRYFFEEIVVITAMLNESS
ncbi:MAG TPA: protoporphyrinogen oxidase, partial [Thermococcus paralvinellae]|nr:protoporphyrinogen oxidase [Thermococcus paralvinellae]